jgi:hypothetical protein
VGLNYVKGLRAGRKTLDLSVRPSKRGSSRFWNIRFTRAAGVWGAMSGSQKVSTPLTTRRADSLDDLRIAKKLGPRLARPPVQTNRGGDQHQARASWPPPAPHRLGAAREHPDRTLGG